MSRPGAEWAVDGPNRNVPLGSTATIEEALIRVGATAPSYTLVFIHGFAMHADPYAEPVSKIVEDDGEALLYDLPGHGGAEGSVSSRTLEAMFDSIAADVAGRAGPVVLAAESRGCAHVEGLSARLVSDGRDVRGVVLFAPPLLLNPLTIGRWALEGVRTAPKAVLANRFPISGPIAESVGDPRWRRALLADPEVRTSVSLQYIARAAWDIARVGPRLRRITVPTLVLRGAKDPLTLPASLRLAHWLCRAADKQKATVEGGRHALLWDPRTPEVVDRVRAWLHRVLA